MIYNGLYVPVFSHLSSTIAPWVSRTISDRRRAIPALLPRWRRRTLGRSNGLHFQRLILSKKKTEEKYLETVLSVVTLGLFWSLARMHCICPSPHSNKQTDSFFGFVSLIDMLWVPHGLTSCRAFCKWHAKAGISIDTAQILFSMTQTTQDYASNVHFTSFHSMNTTPSTMTSIMLHKHIIFRRLVSCTPMSSNQSTPERCLFCALSRMESLSHGLGAGA